MRIIIIVSLLLLNPLLGICQNDNLIRDMIKKYETKILQLTNKLNEIKKEMNNTSIALKNSNSSWEKNKGKKEETYWRKKFDLVSEDLHLKDIEYDQMLKELREVQESARRYLATKAQYIKENSILKNENEELQKQLDYSTPYIETYRKSQDSLEIYKKSTHLIADYNSYFSEIQACYKGDNNTTTCIAIYNEKSEEPVFANNRLWGNKLPIIKYKASVYLEDKTNLSQITGKVIVYVNGDLFTYFDDTLKLSNNNFGAYKLLQTKDNGGKLLEKGIPENSNIRFGFTTNDEFEKNGEHSYLSFWKAYSKGFFSITNLRKYPIISDFALPEGNFDSVGKFYTNKERPYITFKDQNSPPDGDEFEFYLNTELQSNVTLTKEPQKYYLSLNEGINTLAFKAINEGKIPTCTIELKIEGVIKSIPLIALKINKGQYILIERTKD